MTLDDSTHENPRPVWPFAALVALAAPAGVVALGIANAAGVPRSSLVMTAVELVTMSAVAVGVVTTIRREGHNAAARRASGVAPASTHPYVWMAVLALPLQVAISLGASQNVSHLVPLTSPVAAVGMLIAGVTGAVIRANAGKPVEAPTTHPSNGDETPDVIGYTTDGEPIYPIVGQTADGTLVTADRAVGVAPAAARTNGLAIATLIAAFFAPVLAIVLGHVALGQIRRTGERGGGLAMGGLILGYLRVAIGLTLLAVYAGLASLP